MIRINLLPAERERARRKATFQAGQTLAVACSLMLVATALGVGWWYWSIGRDSARLDQGIAAARQEAERLRGLIQQVQLFDQRKAQLQQRVTLIEQLRQGQRAPVHMLDEISLSMPDGLWLTDLKQQGSDVTIIGKCVTLTALSDLVGNLATSEYFKRGVKIIDSQVEPAAPPLPDLIRFSIRAQFSMPAM